MALLNLTAASRAAGVNRSTIVRALKSGRLSATTSDAGERCIDTAELMRVFGALKGDAYADAQAVPMHAIGAAHPVAHPVAQDQPALLDVLQEQLRQAHEREWEGREREARLLAMLEAEQAARRELETKLLPAPRPAPTGKARVWALVGLLAIVVAFAGWRWLDMIVAALAP